MKLRNILFTLNNEYRLRIYNLCLKEKLNITQIQQKINLSYRSVLNHLKILEEAELIKRESRITDKAQESLISAIPFKENFYIQLNKKFQNEK